MAENNITETRESLIAEIERRVNDKILERSNADLLIKLIRNADNIDEAISIAQLGTTYKRTGLHYDKRLEKSRGNTIRYFKKNDELSFSDGTDAPHHKLIIGDNYDGLQNLLVQYRGKVDVIYIDPPYGKDKMGDFAKTNYDNAITRDNLLSMLYPRILLAKQLLSKTGVLFVSIDDKNQAYIKCLLDDVFGEKHFLLNVPRITKKGGKATGTIAKNNDYILAYSIIDGITFNQEAKTNISKYKYEDEFVDERGRYALTQTLDYNSLQYSVGMDYEIELEGRVFVPGGDIEKMRKRHSGEHGRTDWVWRWSKDAVKWGIDNKLLVVKGDRIYTKSYLYCRKKNNKCELEKIEATKAFTSLSFVENKYSNDNGKKELDKIFVDASTLFKNPKPTSLVTTLIEMVCGNDEAVILDFYAGSGTTGHAVSELNKDGGRRTAILCQINEVTSENPNGIAYDVTTKRLKRVMTGSCYDGSTDFAWIKDNEPLGGSLDVYEIESVSNSEHVCGKTPFDVIDETLYGKEKFTSLEDKVKWVCENFEATQDSLVKKKD